MSSVEILFNVVNIIFEPLCISYLIYVILTIIDKDNKIFFNKKRFIKFWIIAIIVALLNKIIHLYFPDYKWLKFVNIVIILSLNVHFNYKTSIYKSIISTVIYSTLSAIIEVIAVLLIKSLEYDPFVITNNSLYNCIYACAIALFEALLSYIVYKSNKSLAVFNNKLKYFLPQLIAIIICLFPTMALLMFNYFKYSVLFLIINLLQLLVVSLVGIFNLKFVVKHENTELELANTITYNETLKKVNEGVRGFKHDMGNIVQALLGYIAINDSEGAKKYIQNLVIGFNDINILSILSPTVIDDPAIYGIVVNKILLARDKNMTLSLDVNLNVSDINFPKFELSRILGILIDNAIEAGENTDEKKLIVNMRHDFEMNVDTITISNSVKDVDIDINKIFEKNYSTKDNPSGFGLYEVNKFIKQNPQSSLLTSIDKETKMFTQSLSIKAS